MTTSTVLPPYNKELAQAGALVCWDNGDGPLRYVGPSTDQSCCGCFVWLAGHHKGTYASYCACDLRMAPAPFRPNGWYWVRKKGWGEEYGDWEPAEWRQDSKSWASTQFSGIPDSEMIVGELLVVMRTAQQTLNQASNCFASKIEAAEDAHSYGSELGAAIRSWITVNAVLLSTTAVAVALGLAKGLAAVVCIALIAMPLIMVLGYLGGAWSRGYKLREVWLNSITYLVTSSSRETLRQGGDSHAYVPNHE